MTKQDLSNRLNELYSSKTSQFVLVAGKPGSGKTSFLKNWIKDKSAIYLRCDLQHDRIQLPRFNRALEVQLEKELKESETWEDFFNKLLKGITKNKRTVIVLDEFPKLVKSSRTILSVIEEIWPQASSKNSLMLILCGSSMPEMKYVNMRFFNLTSPASVVTYVPVQPLTFEEFRQSFPQMDLETSVALYGVTGGTERFVEQLNPTLSTEDNLRYFLSHPNFQYLDPKYLFNFDFHDPTTYFSILQVLAHNEKKIGHIARRLDLKTHNLTSFLDRLRELELIDRILPPTDEVPEASRKGRYHIKDAFYRFWFRYNYIFQDVLSIDNINVVIEEFKTYYPEHMKEVIAEILIEKFQKGVFFPVKYIGPWWDRCKNMDLMVSGSKEMLYVKINTGPKIAGMDSLDHLEREVAFVELPKRIKKETYLILSTNGFAPMLQKEAQKNKNLLLWSLPDIL
ncbi:MAG TPA: ATP-binding protein [Caldisericia bacterium]|nr:ATP-binding protein [Caldisericia bacterium]